MKPKVFENLSRRINIDQISEVVSEGGCSRKKFKIRAIAEKYSLDKFMNNIDNKLKFLPDGLFNFPSQDMFGSDEGLQFFKDHLILGKHRIERCK